VRSFVIGLTWDDYAQGNWDRRDKEPKQAAGAAGKGQGDDDDFDEDEEDDE